jgi:hypothetical protein
MGPISSAMPPSTSAVATTATMAARRIRPGVSRAAASLSRTVTTSRAPPGDGTVRTASTCRTLAGVVVASLQRLVGSTQHASS